MKAFEIPDDDIVSGNFGSDDLNMGEQELTRRRKGRGGV
jgi:hypothetical protein